MSQSHYYTRPRKKIKNNQVLGKRIYQNYTHRRVQRWDLKYCKWAGSKYDSQHLLWVLSMYMSQNLNSKLDLCKRASTSCANSVLKGKTASQGCLILIQSHHLTCGLDPCMWVTVPTFNFLQVLDSEPQQWAVFMWEGDNPYCQPSVQTRVTILSVCLALL